MDIAKYIGLFLLKNHFCYIHGLGNLELRKRSATHDGEALRGPSYEVVITQGGSIDDNLANFIATNEFISISKASNALRDFSTVTRAQLQEGKDVIIPNIGTFHEENSKITFITDPNLRYTPHAIPAMRSDRRPDEAGVSTGARPYTPPLPSMQTVTEPAARPQPSAAQELVQQINWMKVIAAVIALVVIVAIAIFAFKFIKNRRSSTSNSSSTTLPIVPPQPSAIAAQQKADSIAAAIAAKNADTLRPYNFVIDDEPTFKKAEKKVALMRSYGHPDAQMTMQDSSMYLVTLTIKCAPSDTLKIMDSLSRFYAYPGVSIYP